MNGHTRVKMMLAIMAHAAVQIWGFALWFGIVFCAYAMLGFLWFGPTVESFKTLPDALYTLTSVVLGEFDRDAGDWGEPNQITMPLFMVSFSILTKFWTLNMFVAILNYSTLTVQKNHAGIDNDLDLWRYLYRQICMLMGWKTEDAVVAPRNAVNTNTTLEQMLLDIADRLNVKLPQPEDKDREMLAPPQATTSAPVSEKEDGEGPAPPYPDRLLKKESLVLEPEPLPEWDTVQLPALRPPWVPVPSPQCAGTMVQQDATKTIATAEPVPEPAPVSTVASAPGFPAMLRLQTAIVAEDRAIAHLVDQADNNAFVRSVRRLTVVEPVPAAREERAAAAPAGLPVSRLLKREVQVPKPLSVPAPVSESSKLPALRAPRPRLS